MNSSRPGATLFGGILIAILVVGLVYAVSQTNHTGAPAQGGSNTALLPEGLPTSPTDTAAPIPTKDTAPATTPSSPPTLFYIKPVGTGSQLMKRETSGKETVVYIDNDSKLKLGTVIGIIDQKALATMTDGSGKTLLVEILLDGSGTTNTVNSDFGGMAGAAYRPADSTVAFAVFDNAERSFGFTLVQEQLNGTHRSTIDQDTQGLALPVWSQSGKSLAYIKGQATPTDGQQIRIAPNGTNPKTVITAEPNTVITDMTWLDDQSVLYVIEPLGNNSQNKAETILLHVDSGEHTKLFDLPGKERSLVVSKKSDWLAAVTGDVDQAGTGSGKVTLVELSSGKQQVLGIASSIGAWSN